MHTAISVLPGTYFHLSQVPCPRTQHPNNVAARLIGEKHDISLKILHQAGFATTQQAATSAERHALTIAPCPSLKNVTKFHENRLTIDREINEKLAILVDHF